MKSLTCITGKELAAFLQVGVHTINRLRAEGVIRSYRIRTRTRFILEEVLEDLRRSEATFPLRKAAGTLHYSDYIRGRVTKDRSTLGKTIILESVEHEDDADREAQKYYEEEKRNRISKSANADIAAVTRKAWEKHHENALARQRRKAAS